MAADSTVKMTFFSDAQSAQNAIAKLEQKYSELESKIGQTARKSRATSEEADSGLKRWGSGIANIASQYAAVPAIIAKVTASQKEMIDTVDKAALKYDGLFRNLRVQAGLNAVGGEAAQKSVGLLAAKNAVDTDFAARAATQLVSSGFSAEDATGGALDVFLQGMKASNMAEGDPKGMVQSFGQFLAAQGLEKNTENLRKAIVYSQRLFKSGDLEVSDLSQLAGRSQAAAGKLNLEEVFGVFNTLRQKTTADKASTAFQALVDRLAGVSGDPEAKKALARAGIKPKDVDLVGENITEALDRIAAGADRLPEEKRAAFFQDLFGREVGSPIQGLIRDRAEIPKAMAQLKDTSGFAKDVAVATSGKAAARKRFDVLEEIANAEEDTASIDKFNAAERIQRENRVDWVTRKFNRMLAEGLRYIPGIGDDAALALGFAGPGGVTRGDVNNRMKALESPAGSAALTEALEKQNKLLEDIRKNTEVKARRDSSSSP